MIDITQNKYIYVVGISLAIATISAISTGVIVQQRSTVNPLNPVYPILVKDNLVQSGPVDISAQQGERITFQILSNTDGVFSILGNTDSIAVPANKPTTYTFVAKEAGRSEYGFEQQKHPFGNIEIIPTQ